MRLPLYARLAISACSSLLLTCGSQLSVASDPDVNDDGVVNVLDVTLVNGCVSSSPPVTRCLPADINGDGLVTSADLAIVVENYGKTGFPVSDIEEAKRLFCDLHDVAGADDRLAAFLASPSAQTNPQRYQSAKFLRAVTRLLRPFSEPSGGPGTPELDSIPEALDAVGFGPEGRNPLDWTARPPVDELGQCFVPDGGATSEQVEAALRDQLLPRIADSLADLDAVTPGWEDACKYRVIHRHDDGSTSQNVARIEIDYADALLLRSALQASRSVLHFLSAYEADVDLHEAVCEIAPLHRTIQSFLEDPTFDEVGRPADDLSGLPLASADAKQAIAGVGPWLDALHAEIDDPADDLVSLDPERFTPEREALLRMQLAAALTAFDEPTALPGVRICGDARLDFARVFSGLDVRALLPPFVGNLPDLLSLPDATFGGVLPGGTIESVRCTADRRSPVLEGSSERQVLNPHPLVLRLVDPDVGANPGHGVDPGSLVLTMQFVSSECSVSIDGTPACSSAEAPCDITSLVTQTPNPDGSLTLTGEVEVSGDTNRCDIDLRVDAADGVGNAMSDGRSLQIVRAGLLTRFDPPSGFVASPFFVSMEISAPFGDDPTDHMLRLFAFGCGPTRIDGVLVPGSDLGDVFGQDVTSLFALTAGPASLIRSGSVSVESSCELHFQMDYPLTFPITYSDGASYTVVAP